jgi:hypothetical protein
VESKLGSLGLLYLPRFIVRTENLVKWKLAEETQVLGENLPQRHFYNLKFHLIRPEREPGPPRWEACDQPLELWQGL